MFGRGDRDELLQLLEEQRALVAELERAKLAAGRRDPITGLLGWRPFRAQLSDEVRRARGRRVPLALALLEVPALHTLELHHGFAAVDELLGAVGRLVAEQTRRGRARASDLVCHVGGGEFAALMPETPGDGAVICVRRVLEGLEELGSLTIRTTSAAAGVAELDGRGSPEALVADAAGALARAHALGGGRVVLAGAVPCEEASDPGSGAAEGLLSALLERDRYTGEHSESVVEMSVAVATQLGLRPQEVEWVRSAALLHDIGKVGIPDHILSKDGPLDETEWLVMREHPAIGERILRAVPGMGPVARIVRHEHERFDGGGYPDGLAGESIPLGSRIILACDSYHAMTSDRPYRASIGHQAAIDELTRCSGTQFDPQVVGMLVGYLYGARQAGSTADTAA